MMNKRRFTMYTKQPKKMIIINILDILKRYTDENHRLSQREIMDILEREYDMKVDRKAVKRNLMNLIDFGYQVEYSESIRQGKNGEEEIIFTDWYLEKDFTDSELRLLIDSLLFSKHIPYSQCKALIEKLEGLSNCYFKSRVKHIQTIRYLEVVGMQKELIETISKMSELKSLTLKHCCLSSLRGLRNLGNLSELFIEDMGKDPGILEIFSIPSIERLKLFVPREYEQERTDWYLRSLKVNLPMLQWLELEMPAHEFHIETLEGLELRRFGVTSKRFEL